jgi:RNA polymerase sigma factor (sigma-70 family)
MNPLAALLRRAAGDPRPDGALLAAFLADRDEAAFAEVVRRHGGLVWGVCRRTLPDPADAEDAFQATFLVLVRRAGRLTRAATVGPWLHRVAVWTARNLRRKNARRLSRRRELPDALPAPSAPNPPCDLDALLLRLPERYRAALVLCHLGGLTHREAAARLGCAEGTVSSLVSRGLAKLRAKLAADPMPLLVAGLAGAAPASLSAAAVKSAVALQLASLSAAASPAVASLVKGVLPMFWAKKATAAGMMALLLVTTGVGVGVSVRQVPQAVAQSEKPAAKPAAPPVSPPLISEKSLLSLEERFRRLNALQRSVDRERADVAEQIAKIKRELATRKSKTVGGPFFPSLIVSVGGDEGQFLYVAGEMDADGLAYAALSRETDSLRRFLVRMWTHPATPKNLVLEASPDAPPERLAKVLAICKAVGFPTAQIKGRWTLHGDYLNLVSVGETTHAWNGRRIVLKDGVLDLQGSDPKREYYALKKVGEVLVEGAGRIVLPHTEKKRP